MPGFVPNVIIGTRLETSSDTDASYVAPSSLGSMRHRATASSHDGPMGANGRPCRYSNVMSSGAIMPARPPPSMVMLQIVIRSSIVSGFTAVPVYSTIYPVAPATPIFASKARIISLADTPGFSFPSSRTSRVFDFFWRMHCVASTCSTSLVPIPNARAPKAPCVAV